MVKLMGYLTDNHVGLRPDQIHVSLFHILACFILRIFNFSLLNPSPILFNNHYLSHTINDQSRVADGSI